MRAGRAQYADFSGWDIYRDQIQLLALLAPERTSEIDALAAGRRRAERLPAALVLRQRAEHDHGRRLRRPDPRLGGGLRRHGLRPRGGAGGDGQGSDRALPQPQRRISSQRQGLAEYLALGYVPFDLDTKTRNANSIYGDPDAVWGSAATTLEYAVDDFAIAQFAARFLGDASTYRAFMRRSANWRHLFNPDSGMVEPRFADGRFPAHYDNLRGSGFVEGNSAQYTWMVPHDPAGLVRRMGGRGQASAAGSVVSCAGSTAARGDAHRPCPARQRADPAHALALQLDAAALPNPGERCAEHCCGLYDTSPDGYPGNDDLGALSAWYVFGALGLYPEVPGVGLLAIGSPLFERAAIRLRARAAGR